MFISLNLRSSNSARSALLAAGVMFWILCYAPASIAQAPPRIVEAHPVMASDGAHSGTSQKAAIVATVASGYHVNAHKPSFDYLIPTEIKFASNPAVAIEKIVYPAGKPQKFSFSNDPLSVYQGQFLIGLVLKVPAGTIPGVYELKGKLHYQACNDRACFAPALVPLTLTIKVVSGSTPLKPQNTAIFRRLRTSETD